MAQGSRTCCRRPGSRTSLSLFCKETVHSQHLIQPQGRLVSRKSGQEFKERSQSQSLQQSQEVAAPKTTRLLLQRRPRRDLHPVHRYFLHSYNHQPHKQQLLRCLPPPCSSISPTTIHLRTTQRSAQIRAQTIELEKQFCISIKAAQEQ